MTPSQFILLICICYNVLTHNPAPRLPIVYQTVCICSSCFLYLEWHWRHGELQLLLDPVQVTFVNETFPDSLKKICSSFVSYSHIVHNECSYLSFHFKLFFFVCFALNVVLVKTTVNRIYIPITNTVPVNAKCINE